MCKTWQIDLKLGFFEMSAAVCQSLVNESLRFFAENLPEGLNFNILKLLVIFFEYWRCNQHFRENSCILAIFAIFTLKSPEMPQIRP